MFEKIKNLFGINNTKYYNKVKVEIIGYKTILSCKTSDIPSRKVKTVFSEIYQKNISY